MNNDVLPRPRSGVATIQRPKWFFWTITYTVAYRTPADLALRHCYRCGGEGWVANFECEVCDATGWIEPREVAA